MNNFGYQNDTKNKYTKMLFSWMVKKLERIKKKDFPIVHTAMYDCSLEHLFIMDNQFICSVHYPEILKTIGNKKEDILRISTSSLQKGEPSVIEEDSPENEYPAPNYRDFVHIYKDIIDPSFWLPYSFNFEWNDKYNSNLSKEFNIIEFYMKTRLPVRYKNLKDIPNFYKYDIYYSIQRRRDEQYPGAVLFHHKMIDSERRSMFYIVLTLPKVEFNPREVPPYGLIHEPK